MGQVFSNAELSAIVNNQPNLEREREVSATTRSIEVVNNSAYSLRIEGDTQGELITLPQMASKMIVVNPGQRITYTVLPYSISPATGVLNQQYIAVNETSIANETGIQPLALMPVYTTPVDIQNANIPISGNVDATITNPTVNVAGSVQATIENSTLEVSGNVGVTGGTMDVTINGVPEFNLSAGTNVGISGGTVEVSAGSIQVTNPVQTNSLVKLGTTQFNVFDLANSGSLNLLVAGVATGYFQTIVLEGTSQNGYTYTATANAYNRSTNIGSATLTQSNGPNGEFYASGNLSSKQSFGNVQVGLTAQTTTSATIFNDNMQSGANWATKSGAVTYGPSGATFGANGTLITETQTPQLAPQNLTVQASATVQNTSVTNTVNGANVGQAQLSSYLSSSQVGVLNTTANYTYSSKFTVNQTLTLTGLGIYFNSSLSSVTVYLWDGNGNVLASGNIATTTSATFNNVTFNTPVTLQPGVTYSAGFANQTGGNIPFGYSTATYNGTTANNVTISEPLGTFYSTTVGTFPATSFDSGYIMSLRFTYSYPQPLDTSGGARPVMLSNGWIVSVFPNVSASQVIWEVSKDNGNTWATLTVNNGWLASATSPNLSICSNGTMVYTLVGASNFSAVSAFSFDATTVGATVNYKSQPDAGQSSFGPGNDIKYNAVDGSLHGVWCSKNSTYPNSNNVRYSKSTDGGTTWQAVTQITMVNTSGITGFQNPKIDFHNNISTVVAQGTGVYISGGGMNTNSSYTSLSCILQSGTGTGLIASGWTGYNIYNNATYSQQNPTFCVAPNGTIGVAWQGTDATYTSNPQIKFSYSTDGTTWSSAVNIDPQTGITENTPSITADQAGYLYVGYDVNRNLSSANSYIVRSTDGGVTWVRWMNIPYWFNLQLMAPTSLNVIIPLMIGMNSNTNYTQFWGKWIIGSHTMLGVEYWKDAQNYYLLQWLNGNLNLIKCVGGTVSTITSAVVNETSTTVTLKLVVASNGNLTGTLSGAGTNTVTGNDTAVTLGSLGITGDNGVVVTNGFISGNYIPSDTVTVDVYAI